MRPATILASGLVVLLVGTALYMALGGAGDDARPPGPLGHPDEAQPAPAPPPHVERAPAGGEGEQPAPAAAAGAPTTELPRAEPADAGANVELRVRTVAAHRDIGAFTWRFRSGATVLRGSGQDGHAALQLPPEGRGQLLVEAPGFAPFTAELTAPAQDQPASTVDAFLAAAARAAGITLLVRDTALQPITNVRVDAFPLPPEAHDSAWHLGAALWARRTAAEDGHYVLPELAPGDYGIRVLATDPDGKLLPLLPYLHTFTLTGSSGYVEEVVLEPGCVPEFELVDATGAPIDPHTAGIVQLRLHLPGGGSVPRMWSREQDGRTTVALDTLPGRGVVSLAQPVPAGTYTLVVTIADQQRVQQFVTLRAGERQRERIVVP